MNGEATYRVVNRHGDTVQSGIMLPNRDDPHAKIVLARFSPDLCALHPGDELRISWKDGRTTMMTLAPPSVLAPTG